MSSTYDDSERTEEERIIEIIRIEGGLRQYEDNDFLTIRQSLYEIEDIPGSYDDAISQLISWHRPHEICKLPEYFSDTFTHPTVQLGTLPEAAFMGALMAVCSFPDYDLMENIFASRPEDFRAFGLYTCRFYVDGDWVEVLTDTRLPCCRDDNTGYMAPAYARSIKSSDMWIPLVEKAYAKAVGCYESIIKIKAHEVLLHLTGGSVQQVNLHEHHDAGITKRAEENRKWKILKGLFCHDTMVIAQADSKAHIEELDKDDDNDLAAATAVDASDKLYNAIDITDAEANMVDLEELEEVEDPVDKEHELFIPGRLYSMQCYKEIGPHHLVLIHDPWGATLWEGHWSQHSSKWDDFPEVLYNIKEDKFIKWTKEDPCGYFWMQISVFLGHFSQIFVCKLFPNDKFSYYCARGEWKDSTCGGPLVSIRDKEAVLSDFSASKLQALSRALPMVSIDGDSSWFCNPQYHLRTVDKSVVVHLSVVPVAGGNAKNAPVVGFSVVSTPKSLNYFHVWDISSGTVVATETKEGSDRARGQEASLWHLTIDPKLDYHIIPNCSKKAAVGSFIVRVFSHTPIVMESMGPLFVERLHSEWKRHGDIDLCGGPLVLAKSDEITSPDSEVKKASLFIENAKWGQNPQIQIKLGDFHGTKDPVHLKIILRKTDKSGIPIHDKNDQHAISFIVCKPEYLRELNLKKKKFGAVRENALGVAIPTKASSLKLEKQSKHILAAAAQEAGQQPNTGSQRQILKRVSLVTDTQYFQTPGSSKSEACMYFPSFPRQLLIDGLMVIPSLDEKGVKSHFILEAYASEEIKLFQLPDKKMKILAGEWDEKTSFGSHICPSWKKNPKFSLKFKPRSTPTEKFRVSLHKLGEESWKKANRVDHLGSMIGFYIFCIRRGDSSTFFESAFVPDREIATDDLFTLDVLGGPDDEYIIMPTTFNEGVIGQFVLSVIADCDFSLTKKLEAK